MTTSILRGPFGEIKVLHAVCNQVHIRGARYYGNGPSVSYWSISLNGKCFDTALTKGRAMKRARTKMTELFNEEKQHANVT